MKSLALALASTASLLLSRPAAAAPAGVSSSLCLRAKLWPANQSECRAPGAWMDNFVRVQVDRDFGDAGIPCQNLDAVYEAIISYYPVHQKPRYNELLAPVAFTQTWIGALNRVQIAEGAEGRSYFYFPVRYSDIKPDSYGEITITTSVNSRFDGIQSFRSHYKGSCGTLTAAEDPSTTTNGTEAKYSLPQR